MDNPTTSRVSPSLAMMSIVVSVLFLITGAILYFFGVTDAVVFLATSFTALYISTGEEATHIRDDIAGAPQNGKGYLVPRLRKFLIIRFVISTIIAILGLGVIFLF